MLPLEVVFDVPPAIVRGLATGALERVGGVIRETGSKQVVMWLREGAKIADNSNLAGGVLKSLLNVRQRWIDRCCLRRFGCHGCRESTQPDHAAIQYSDQPRDSRRWHWSAQHRNDSCINGNCFETK